MERHSPFENGQTLLGSTTKPFGIDLVAKVGVSKRLFPLQLKSLESETITFSLSSKDNFAVLQIFRESLRFLTNVYIKDTHMEDH